MKTTVFLIICFAVVCCSTNNGRIPKYREYSFDELTVSFVRNTQVATFIKDDRPVSGTVTRDLRNGGKSVWEVEKGLATKQIVFYPNGQIRRSMELKNGVEHGSFVIFFSDGQKYMEQFFEEGKPSGTWHRWNRDGELIETVEH